MSSGRASTPGGKGRRRARPAWDAAGVRTLRRHLGLTQAAMAEELGTRQQTVSEWETGLYRPRGASARLLTLIAEGAGFAYDAGGSRGPAGAAESRSAGLDRDTAAGTENRGDAGRP